MGRSTSSPNAPSAGDYSRDPNSTTESLMSAKPIALVHGYSDEGASFRTWKEKLASKFQAEKREIHICNYISLNNEITIKDRAEGFDRTLRQCAGLEKDQPFDAVVHSTGML